MKAQGTSFHVIEAKFAASPRDESVAATLARLRAPPGCDCCWRWRKGGGWRVARQVPRDGTVVSHIFFTSGSTGRPKGCLATHRALRSGRPRKRVGRGGTRLLRREAGGVGEELSGALGAVGTG